MTKKLETQYWDPIVQIMKAEDIRLRLYVRHKHSLGVGRESILRNILISHTPEPYRVKTGFVTHLSDEPILSNQCDILVYDPTISQPYYSIDEFVVVPYQAARVAIEVRSKLTIGQQQKPISGLDQMFKVCKTLREFSSPRQVFGFAFSGVPFDKFITAMVQRVNGDIFNAPECIAVQKKNYICVRVTKKLAMADPAKPDPKLCIAIDFLQTERATSGLATAYFLALYNARVRNNEPFAVENIGFLARDLKIPDAAIRIVDEKGQVTSGPVPV